MKHKKIILDFIIIILGSAIYSFAVTVLLSPYDIVPGGVTGLAVMLCALFPWLSLGLVVLLLNLPLFLLSLKLLGARFVAMTAVGTLAVSVFIEVFSKTIPSVETEPMLAGIFGGLLAGVGLGLVFTRGATTGGSDIAARLLKFIFPSAGLGKLLLAFDGVVVALSGLCFGSVNIMLFAAIALYISSRTLDGILYGLNVERVAYVVTDKTAQITDVIVSKMQRGATILHGEGAFTGAERNIILCAIKRQQVAEFKSIVREMDPYAFMFMADASEVIGEGFMARE